MNYEWDPNDWEYWKNSINWEEYLVYAEEHSMHWKDISKLKSMKSHRASWKQIRVAKIVVEKIDTLMEEEE
jgi:hypothetical protein